MIKPSPPRRDEDFPPGKQVCSELAGLSSVVNGKASPAASPIFEPTDCTIAIKNLAETVGALTSRKTKPTLLT